MNVMRVVVESMMSDDQNQPDINKIYIFFDLDDF